MRSPRMRAVLVLSALLPAALAGAPAGATTAAGHWHRQTSVGGGALSSLLGVTTVSASNAWAVGLTETTGGGRRTLIEHYDGHTWSKQSSPNPGPGAELHAVKAVTSTDVWAVGVFEPNPPTEEGMILHYDGAVWSQAKLVPGASWFYGVAQHGANEAWAVGTDATTEGTYVEHFNGTAWSHQSSPKKGTFDLLSSVSAAGPNNVWAVGEWSNSSTLGPIVMHYDGSAWHFQSLPSLPNGTILDSVSVHTSSDVWAVGWHAMGTAPDILHWNGTAWHKSTPAGGVVGGAFFGVKAVSDDDAWAVGVQQDGQLQRTLIEHWDGGGWHTVGSPTGSAVTQLRSVASTGSGNSFSVGETGTKTFIVHCDC